MDDVEKRKKKRGKELFFKNIEARGFRKETVNGMWREGGKGRKNGDKAAQVRLKEKGLTEY